jgi:ubiquitin-protein ligase
MLSTSRLSKEYAKLNEDPIDNVTFEIKGDNFLEWKFTILGPSESPYEGGIYEGIITYPSTYPHDPPKVRFTTKLFHPNVYNGACGGDHKIGDLCISILHKGTDETSGEHELERWRPIQTVRGIFLSIISLLNDPNADSAANVDAAKLWRDNKELYYKKIRNDMEI